MAGPDAWPGLERHGLLSTKALLDLFEVATPGRGAIEGRHRPQSVRITHPLHGGATIRDQIPLSEKRLRSALIDMTVDDWYEFLANHVFFWPTQERVRRILGALAYREEPQLVVTVDTAQLVNRYAPCILLSPINTGATQPFAWPRGRDTVKSLNSYPLEARVRAHGRARAVAEVLVKRGIERITDVALCASVWLDGAPIRTVWKRGAIPSVD